MWNLVDKKPTINPVSLVSVMVWTALARYYNPISLVWSGQLWPDTTLLYYSSLCIYDIYYYYMKLYRFMKIY